MPWLEYIALISLAAVPYTLPVCAKDDNENQVAWPISSDQVRVRTRDGKPPRGQEALWSQVWSLGQVDNIYDLGGLENLLDVLRGR